MNTRLPCGLDDERICFEDDGHDRARAVEIYADNLMDECKSFNLADRINRDHDLYDGDLLTWMMVAVANWTGRSDSAAQYMNAMHNLLANELHKIAERETA